jgi:hypothetical protein
LECPCVLRNLSMIIYIYIHVYIQYIKILFIGPTRGTIVNIHQYRTMSNPNLMWTPTPKNPKPSKHSHSCTFVLLCVTSWIAHDFATLPSNQPPCLPACRWPLLCVGQREAPPASDLSHRFQTRKIKVPKPSPTSPKIWLNAFTKIIVKVAVKKYVCFKLLGFEPPRLNEGSITNTYPTYPKWRNQCHCTFAAMKQRSMSATLAQTQISHGRVPTVEDLDLRYFDGILMTSHKSTQNYIF